LVEPSQQAKPDKTAEDIMDAVFDWTTWCSTNWGMIFIG
jgi:hypothetical protein